MCGCTLSLLIRAISSYSIISQKPWTSILKVKHFKSVPIFRAWSWNDLPNKHWEMPDCHPKPCWSSKRYGMASGPTMWIYECILWSTVVFLLLNQIKFKAASTGSHKLFCIACTKCQFLQEINVFRTYQKNAFEFPAILAIFQPVWCFRSSAEAFSYPSPKHHIWEIWYQFWISSSYRYLIRVHGVILKLRYFGQINHNLRG